MTKLNLNETVELNVSEIIERFTRVRSSSEALCEPLLIEDYGLQAMPETSPAKWHLAHTTWFFETFLLKLHSKTYKPLNAQYEYLFNSYYNRIGEQYPRPQRGLLSRPSVEEVYLYRHHVNNAMLDLLSSDRENNEELLNKVILGCHHEQQHQELFFTDLKYSWFKNPLYPVYEFHSKNKSKVSNLNTRHAGNTSGNTGHKNTWFELTEDVYEIGFSQNSSSLLQQFCFDNELPRHKQYIHDASISEYLVTNREYLVFLADDGYHRSEFWLSDAWAAMKNPEYKHHPLYWVEQNGEWFEYTLNGLEPLNYEQPVCHLSAYEADAYARWKECRLPTEFEWEIFAKKVEQKTNGATKFEPYEQFLESEIFHPSAELDSQPGINGKLWQWTSSAYSPYPGYKPAAGAIGEYNGKFMCNQLVLRGGSCVTSKNHYRHSYRNFFYPQDQWQFSGLRLAK